MHLQDQEGYEMFFLFVVFVFFAQYDDVTGRLCRDTSNCRHSNAAVIEHYYLTHRRSACSHNQWSFLAQLSI